MESKRPLCILSSLDDPFCGIRQYFYLITNDYCCVKEQISEVTNVKLYEDTFAYAKISFLECFPVKMESQF